MKTFSSRPVPTGSFAAVMGIAGLGLAWRSAVRSQHVSPVIGESLIALGAIVFVALVIVWLARIMRYPGEVMAENGSAITGSYYGTILISCSLLAAGALPYSRAIAFVLWVISAFGGAALLIFLLGCWIQRGIKDSELTPALFIPVVGNATSIYAGVPLGMIEIGWASFSFALLCWLTIGPLTMYRLLVVEPRLPRKMAPQVAVLVSSPAVMSSAWFLLNGGVADAAFKILAFKALFFTLLALRLWRLAWGEPFHLGMWGWTFPAAALSGAFERAVEGTPSLLYDTLATITLAAATVSVAGCIVGAVAGWIRAFRAVKPESR